MVLFFVLTFAISWAVFVPVAMLSNVSLETSQLAILPGVFAPAIVAIALTWREHGRAGVAALLARLLVADVPLRCYLFAILLMPAVKLSSAGAHRLLFGEWPAFGATPVWIIIAGIIVSAPVQAGEEIGWRGYALPRLAEQFGMGVGSLILGVVWAAWHLPHFYVLGASTFNQPFVLYAVQVTALSVALAWLYWRTGGSLLLVMLMHAAINNTKDLVPSVAGPGAGVWSLSAPPVAWLTALVLSGIAAALLPRLWAVRPSRSGLLGSTSDPAVSPD